MGAGGPELLGGFRDLLAANSPALRCLGLSENRQLGERAGLELIKVPPLDPLLRPRVTPRSF